MTWQFQPEPRSFQIVEQLRGMITLTKTNDQEAYTVWIFNTVRAQGSRELMQRVFDGFRI